MADQVSNLVIRDIPLMGIAYFSWKYFKKTKIVRLDEIALEDAFEQAALYPDEPEEKQKGWIRLISWVWD